ncbi:PAQR family membrane homeostasis protein TrhA [Lactovum miscens]|uniref:Hemolysin III n=1 Tax=Lactovum miscens TaxID=190387 RepID=A0A841C981_9LACT|nr:hemolysin III family protein [Lactovum miscens]MBB5887770.1 hemolysin III [Lactovum miscens]
MKKQTSKTYLIVNEIFNATTHGIATGLAIAGMILLILKGVHNSSPIEVVSFTIYGAMLVLLFLFSTLHHSLYFSRAHKVFQVFDHAGIFLLIAGTYTPYCLITLNGWIGWTILSIVWPCAILGIVFTAIFLPRAKQVPKFSTVLYVVMGWLILLAFLPLYHLLTATGFWLLVAGGVIYTVGALIYRYKFFFSHVLWHIFVLVAAMLIWFSIYFYVG